MRIKISETDYDGWGINRIASFSELIRFANANEIAILSILEHRKADEWPVAGERRSSVRQFTIPLIWGILSTLDNSNLQLEYDIHPGKCFPRLYNASNEHSATRQMPLISEHSNEGGCARTLVAVRGVQYRVADLIPVFCSVFGLPDECYSSAFQIRMLEILKQYGRHEVWSFKKTSFSEAVVQPVLNLHYLQEEILPKKYYLYVDSSENYLRGIIPAADLKPLRAHSWYRDGSEFIDERDPKNDEGFSNEDAAERSVIMRILFESIRLLLMRRDAKTYSSFVPVGFPSLDLTRRKEADERVAEVMESVRSDSESYIRTLMVSIKNRLDWTDLRKKPFVIMDMEYLHSVYPSTAKNRTFNFPCIFANIVVLSEAEISLRLFANKLVCNYCTSCPCPSLKKKSAFNFDCLCYSRTAIDESLAFLEEMMVSYENLHVYSYGKSDCFEIEHAHNFFSSETEQLRFVRKNRLRARRITEIAGDLSIDGKSLTILEDEVLSKWLLGWKRRKPKVDVNPRFLTPIFSESWEQRFREALSTPVDDALSALLLYLHSRDSTDKTPDLLTHPTCLDDFD
jgi:hypothetical protein